MHNMFHKLIKNRVTVSFACLLFFLFFIIPSIMVLNWLIPSSDPTNHFSPKSLLIIITYLCLLIVWHVGSHFLKENLLKKKKISSNDFIDDYESGFEVLVDVNTFGQGKKIGYEKLKVLFTCHVIATGLIIMILLILIAVGKFELLTYLTEKNLIIPVGTTIYLSTILAIYRTVKLKLTT